MADADPNGAPAAEPVPAGDTDAPDTGPVDAIKQLIADAQAAAESESALLRLCGQIALGAAKGMSLWSLVALACALIGLLALAIGAVILIGQYVSPWLAIATVPGLLFAAAAVAACRVRTHARALQRAVTAVRG